MAKSAAVIGGQWGDEGKGKIVDLLLQRMSNTLLERYQGGANAGHTVKIGDKEYHLHLLPSGMMSSNTFNLIGKGVFLDPRKVITEIKSLTDDGVKIDDGNFGIAANAHITLDYHVSADQKNFNLEKHTSTGSGIKQTATDKYNRVGIRFVEFLNKNSFLECLQRKFPEGTIGQVSLDEFIDSYSNEQEFLAQFLVDETALFADPSFEYFLAEGAQGFGLDIDDGAYPGITSSNPTLPKHRPEVIIGVFKAYESSVGIGDRYFISQMDKELECLMPDLMNEYGTTTHKPRNVGWFDALGARHAIKTTHMDHIVLTCIDKLERLVDVTNKLKVVVGYEINGVEHHNWHPSFYDRTVLRDAKPIYETFELWNQTVERDGKTLTLNAQKYVDGIQEIIGKEFSLIGTGPERNEILVYKDVLGGN